MLRIRRTELTMTAKANEVFRRLVLLRQARPSRSCCPSSRVCLTCPERIGHAGALFICCPLPIAANITKLRRPSSSAM